MSHSPSRVGPAPEARLETVQNFDRGDISRRPAAREMPKPRLKLRESRHDGMQVLHFRGEIDLHLAPALRALFRSKAARRCPLLVADFTELEFIDSTGIAVLIEYLRDATKFGGAFCIAGVSGPVADIFQVVHLERAIPIYANVEDVRSALRHGVIPTPAQPLFGDGPESRPPSFSGTAVS